MSWLKSAQDYFKRNPFVVDGSIALALFLISLFASDHMIAEGQRSQHDALFVLLLLVQVVPIIWRRTQPGLAFAITLAGFLTAWAFKYPDSFGNNALLVNMYSIGAYLPRRKAMGTALSIVGVGLLVSIPITTIIDPPNSSPFSIISTCAFFLCAWLLGSNIRLRRANVEALEERAVQAERARDEEALRAAERERTRIAREMHDIVAHSMSVMVVQAGAARKMLAANPERATEALLTVEQTGREGLSEMRRLLGVLREGDSKAAEFAPQPSVARIDELVAATSCNDVTIDVHTEGDVQPLTPGVDLCAYRIVQESLTNVRKHAGRANVDVTLKYEGTCLTLTIADDGRGAAHDVSSADGHGLEGMRERVSIYNGELTAGPRRGGGFVVTAKLPINENGTNAHE